MAMLTLASSAFAGLNIYTGQGSFDAAVTSGGYSLMGIEKWDSGVGTGIIAFNDPLAPGVANGPFATGTQTSMGMTVQSNTLGDSPVNLSPAGNGGLAFASAGTAGVSGNLQASNQVSANLPGNSFDLRFTTVGGIAPKAVDLSPMFYRVLSTNNAGALNVRVYDTSNVLIGSLGLLNVGDVLENRYAGFEVTGSTTLGRVNIAVDHSTLDVAGADNIRLYGANPVPEPATLSMLGLGALALLKRRRK